MQIELDQKTETIHKINEYLRHGGLFNPELMDPEAVRNMLLEVRDVLADVKENNMQKLDRKVHYIDVSKMTEKEICMLLDIEYVPWYRSPVFWALVLLFNVPTFLLIASI